MQQSQVTSGFEMVARVAERCGFSRRWRLAPCLEHVQHRPWPVRRGPWLMAQTWSDLLFAHWPIEPDSVRALLPPGLELDTFDGRAWLSVVVFQIGDVHLRGWPPMPGLRSFPEVNLRTYVRFRDQPGVWFMSLHCPNRLAMAVARPWYLLPYHHTPLHLHDGVCDSPIFRACYEPSGAPFARGPLDEWLTERYGYYTATSRGLYRCDIHHMPWPLQPAALRISCNALVPDSRPPERVHYAERIESLIWPLSPLRPRSASAPRPAPSGQPARP
jgi:uncharacterized protein